MRCFTLGGAAVLLCHTRDGVHAVDNICTHAYARLDEGRLRGHRLICPLHGASFDARTGAVLGAPATQPLRTYPGTYSRRSDRSRRALARLTVRSLAWTFN